MKIKKIHFMGIIAAVVILLLDVIFLREEPSFYFILGIAAVVATFPFFFSFLIQAGKGKEKEEKFLEFSRNLVESVKSGTPISRSIINIADKDYGSLTQHIKKLSNQITLGIPVKSALGVFSRDVNNPTVSRAITLISEADQAGGEIESILESVARSVSQISELKKERKAAIYNLMVQGYIIFMIFIAIMLVMEFKILPMAEGISLDSGGGEDLGGIGLPFGMGGGEAMSSEDLAKPFLYLLLIQGFFAGITIGKLAEGNIMAGIKHSFILMALAFLVSTGAKAFLG